MFNDALSAQVKAGDWRGAGWLYGGSPHRDIQVPAADERFALWATGLTKLGVKAMPRQYRVIPGELSWGLSKNVLELSFTLPSGSYATSLLHELIEFEGRRVA